MWQALSPAIHIRHSWFGIDLGSPLDPVSAKRPSVSRNWTKNISFGVERLERQGMFQMALVLLTDSCATNQTRPGIRPGLDGEEW